MLVEGRALFSYKAFVNDQMYLSVWQKRHSIRNNTIVNYVGTKLVEYSVSVVLFNLMIIRIMSFVYYNCCQLATYAHVQAVQTLDLTLQVIYS